MFSKSKSRPQRASYISVRGKLSLVVFVASIIAVLPLFVVKLFSIDVTVLLATCFVLFNLVLARYLMRDIKEGLSALETGLLNLKDGEYSTTLAYNKDDELGGLCVLFNETITQLRDEKHGLYQRELLLDKVTQSSPEVLFLVNDKQQVIFGNIAAKRFFNRNTRLEGEYLTTLLLDADDGVQQALSTKSSGLFTLTPSQHDMQTWHVSTGNFVLNNQSHTLFILKQMTRELSRQEVAVWKKVIRVISHELNNSLGPISSMLHSGKILSENLDEQRLSRVFSTIDERIQHLSTFVQGYGKFAKLPEPKPLQINWKKLVQTLSAQWQFVHLTQDNLVIEASVYADPIQLEQLLINLLKNAHESGSCASNIGVELTQNSQETQIIVTDKGCGVTDAVMSSALIPFYSTKSNGSGLGLALCREIVDAHHGHIGLENREHGGLSVKVTLPRHT